MKEWDVALIIHFAQNQKISPFVPMAITHERYLILRSLVSVPNESYRTGVASQMTFLRKLS